MTADANAKKGLTFRWATMDDLEALRALMARAIEQLQDDFLTPEQVKVSHQVMGLDTQLIKDGTYVVVEVDGQIAGCGGWSYRSTLFGGDTSVIAREPEELNPATDAARIRAMYTNPDFKRRGIGRKVMALCEEAAREAGFKRIEMMATLAGEPLYRACGYEVVEDYQAGPIDGVIVPMKRMAKTLD